jgi:NTP pyrophosphatase (non-canonical NTP hydrolase)
MTLNDYQLAALDTDLGNELHYYALGLGGEAGEVLDIIKKAIRDDGGEFTDESVYALKAELGDVLWYLATLAAKAGFTLDEVATNNVEKLASRKARGVIGGSGDYR